ncbi:MAG: hypothetical protein ABI893_10405 [Polaromonas sp.]|uniref:hypothetical protein n=1 Tax=Polaromonas sp. TaxID=1869339 RepID=UPI003266BB49
MTPLELDQLQQCPDIATLQVVFRNMCSHFGSVAQLKVLPASHAGKQQALCFVRMASDEEEQRLMSGLGIGRFGGELVVVVDLQIASSLVAPGSSERAVSAAMAGH